MADAPPQLTPWRPGERPTGRAKGTVNKTTKLLKDAILEAAALAGGKEGLVGYLTKQAIKNPAAFVPLLGRVLPMQINASHQHTVVIVGGLPSRDTSPLLKDVTPEKTKELTTSSS